jgi:ABC-type phosphate transport system substrate-binding protein
MSAFKQKTRSLGIRAGILAGASAAVLAVFGMGAGSAMASPTCVTGSGTLQGEGSTLQKVAQEEWNSVYNAACPSASHFNFKYTGTGSGAALKSYGYTGGGAVNTGEAYVGTDEAPSAGEISEVKTRTGVAPVVIPIAETSIAVIANKPANCALTGGITWANLNELFAGTKKHWSELSTIANKSACETAEAGASITRIVRSDGSGTTYQFKNYLAELQKAPISAAGPGKVETAPSVCTAETWSALRPNPTLNLLWPKSGCNTGVTAVETAEGGGGVVNAVAAKSNSIGYAAYSDVFHAGKTSLAVALENGNEVGVGPTYALPGKGTSSQEANCGSRVYTVPAAGRATGGTGLEVDWSEVFGAKPEIGTAYPLCTLTFNLSWNGFSSVGFATHTGEAVKAYLGYELGEGQSTIAQKGYQVLPTSTTNANNVAGAAALALTKVVE